MLNWYRVFVVVLVKNKGFISGNGGLTGRVIQISKTVTRFVAEPTFCGGGGGEFISIPVNIYTFFRYNFNFRPFLRLTVKSLADLQLLITSTPSCHDLTFLSDHS